MGILEITQDKIQENLVLTAHALGHTLNIHVRLASGGGLHFGLSFHIDVQSNLANSKSYGLEVLFRIIKIFEL